VEYLLSIHADVNKKDRWGHTPLVDAVSNGTKAVARLLRSKGGELSYDEVTTSAELCELARKGSIDMLKLLVEVGADINSTDYDQRTCLHLAASEGNGPVVEYLLSAGATPNAKDRWGGTPLRDAVRHNHGHVTTTLRAMGGVLAYSEVEASAELCELARRGSLELLRQQVLNGVAVDAADYDKRTCLHLAASEGNLPICELLVGFNADINARDRWGGTPLRDAAREGHAAVARSLHARGGELGLDAVETSGMLCELTRKGSLDLLKLLVECGASVAAVSLMLRTEPPHASNRTPTPLRQSAADAIDSHLAQADYDKRTCLHLAASEGSLPICELLVGFNADINARDRWGGTPLRDAAREGHAAVARSLHARGGELGLDAVETSGVLCELTRKGSLDLLKLLVECGGRVNSADYDSRTCLHIASSCGNLPIVQFLLDQGADASARDRWGGAPLTDATHHKHEHVAQVLQARGAAA
jgi:ankyrin repeat protein